MLMKRADGYKLNTEGGGGKLPKNSSREALKGIPRLGGRQAGWLARWLARGGRDDGQIRSYLNSAVTFPAQHLKGNATHAHSFRGE